MSSKREPKRNGRPPVWVGATLERAQAEICRRIAEGETLRGVCRDPKMPSKSVVLEWLNEDASFAARYAQAREALADHWADEILDIADDEARDENSTAVQRDRLRVDTRKWIMSKVLPRKYGERINVAADVNVTSKDELVAQAAALGLTKEQLFGG